MAIERNASITHPAAEQFRREVEEVEADMMALWRQRHASKGLGVLKHTLFQLAGSVSAVMAEAEPADIADTNRKLADMALYVSTAGQRAQ